MDDNKLYVVETPFVGLPKLTIWDLAEERPMGYMVKYQGYNKVLHKSTAGRRYFLTREKVVRFLADEYRSVKEEARRVILRMDRIHDLSDEDLLQFAKGKEEVVDRVEAAAKEG